MTHQQVASAAELREASASRLLNDQGRGSKTAMSTKECVRCCVMIGAFGNTTL